MGRCFEQDVMILAVFEEYVQLNRKKIEGNEILFLSVYELGFRFIRKFEDIFCERMLYLF